MIDWAIVRAGLLAATVWGWAGCRPQWLVGFAMRCRWLDEVRKLDRLPARTSGGSE